MLKIHSLLENETNLSGFRDRSCPEIWYSRKYLDKKFLKTKSKKRIIRILNRKKGMKEGKLKSVWNEVWIKVETKYPTKTSDYYISNYGRIKKIVKATEIESELRGSTLKRSAYKTLNIRLTENKSQHIYIHKFVAEHFIRKTSEDQKYVFHINGDKSNNTWTNLSWQTKEELILFLREKGNLARDRGEIKHAKLTETQVRLLKQRIKKGKTKLKILAKQFDISETHVKRIARGENWGHIESEEELTSR